MSTAPDVSAPLARKPVHFRDYVLSKQSVNTSSRFVGFSVMMFLLVVSMALFELREDYFEVQQDFDGTTAVEVSLAATGFVSYYQDTFFGDDDEAAECFDRYFGGSGSGTVTYFQNRLSSGSFDQTDIECAALILGNLNTTDLSLCNQNELLLQLNGGTDEVNCGVNSMNNQGCLPGFYQPLVSSDPKAQGPAKACPDGQWCPSGFTCTIPCVYGSFCVQSTLGVIETQTNKTNSPGVCSYPHKVSGNVASSTIYDTARSSCTASVIETDEVDDQANVDDILSNGVTVFDNVSSTEICPGMDLIPLCPKKWYCPSSKEIYKCPKGYYCPRGTYKPTKCAVAITCLREGMAYPDMFLSIFFTFWVGVFVIAVSARAFALHKLAKRSRRRVQQREEVLSRALRRKELQEENERVAFERTSIALNRQKSGQLRMSPESASAQQSNGDGSLGSSISSQKSEGSENLNTAGATEGFTWWLFIGCDQEGWAAVLVLSLIEGVCGIVMEVKGDIPFSIILIVIGFTGFCFGLFAWVVLRYLNQAALKDTRGHSMAQSSSRGSSFGSTHGNHSGSSGGDFDTSTSSNGNEHGFKRGSVANMIARQWTEMTGMHHTEDPKHRTVSVADRMKDDSLLGSLKEKTETRVNISFQKLGLRLNSNKAVVLAGVDGHLNAGCVTAIMGPSGAGKTTFLNTLCGRATYGTTTGRLLFNGREDSVASFSRLVGFVPQEDTMHRELTVREILKSYAVMRLPRTFSVVAIERVVQDVIEALQLDHVSDSCIGDEATRGISGGQRKRVNVGMEMVADPSLLFLDEPTSGLDSTTSFDLVYALNAMAKKGVNVIMVLHQPSYPLYQMFTNALLLGKGGRTVFLGKSEDALNYFMHIGYTMPPFLNPADFFMDVIAGKYSRSARQSAYEKYGGEEDQTDLFQLWARHRNHYEQGRLFGDDSGLAATTHVQTLNNKVEPIDVDAYMLLRPAGFWRCLNVCTKRAATQHTRSLTVALFDVLLHCGTGAFLGAASGTINLTSLAQANLMFSLGLTMTIGLASLRVFGAERVVFWREAAPGAGMDLSPLPYFIGKNIVELPRLAILTACLVAFFYPFVSTLCNPDVFFVRALAASWNISGWAVMLSILFNDKSAQLILVILCLVFMLYAGTMSKLSSMSSVEYGLSWLSPNRWLVEDLFVCHADTLSAAFRLPPQWYKKKNDSLIGFLVAFSYSEQFTENSSIESSSNDDGSAKEETVDEGVVVTMNLLNFYCNIWFGVLMRFLGFLCLIYANRVKMSKPSLRMSFLRSINTFLRICFPDLDMEHGWVSVKKYAATMFKGEADREVEKLNEDWDKVTKSNAVSRATEARATVSCNGSNPKNVGTSADEGVNLGAIYGEEKNHAPVAMAMSNTVNPMAASTAPAPLPLPEGWAAVEDTASGKTYYHKAATGETSWTIPTNSRSSSNSPLNATEV